MFTDMSAGNNAIPALLFLFSGLGIVVTRFQLKFEENEHLLRKLMAISITILSLTFFSLGVILSFSELGKQANHSFPQKLIEIQEVVKILMYIVAGPLFVGSLISIGYEVVRKNPEER